MDSVNDQIMSYFKIKDYSLPKRAKSMCGGGKKPSKLKNQKQSEASIIKNIRNLFRQKNNNNKATKDIKNKWRY